MTLVKAAAESAKIDPDPPRPTFAYIPVCDGSWLGFEVAYYDSQLNRVQIRAKISDILSPETRIVGEYPVKIRGKLGSSVTLIPRKLVEAVDLSMDDSVTVITLARGLILFVTKQKISSSQTKIEDVLDEMENLLHK